LTLRVRVHRVIIKEWHAIACTATQSWLETAVTKKDRITEQYEPKELVVITQRSVEARGYI
jgi:hypothetical protein